MYSVTYPKWHPAIRRWLYVCCGMIFVMALLGAITRLTESGLSIIDWSPLAGALPPLNDVDWTKAFKGYQQIPQYSLLHRGMTLEEFKHIYFWEWFHRLWGRLIGLVFALPFFYFLFRGRIEPRLIVRLALILALGGLQGFIGWYMVKSGLSERTDVSPYRLSLHLNFALLIYSLQLWTALGLYPPERMRKSRAYPKSMATHGWIALALLAITLIWGALVAGLHAGEAYNTWPLMDGDVIPEAAFTILPKWHNVFENLAFVQFLHRWLGPTTMLLILTWVWRRLGAGASKKDQNWALGLAGMALAQVGLGMATLLSGAEIILAVLHQAGAVTLLTLLLINLKRFRNAQIIGPGRGALPATAD
jgi:cytochrome c oxidase assembly protein subunit 15